MSEKSPPRTILQKKGDEVIKYGESLGVMTEDAAKGHWVSHNNLVSVPRDYDSEMVQE